MSNTRSVQRGFSIMELLVVVTIVGILAAIAFPSYREYVMRTNRTVAKVALQELVTKQESYAVDHKAYATSFARLGIAGTGTATVAYVSSDGALSLSAANAIYTLTLVGSCPAAGSGSTTSFAISAERTSPQTDSRCGVICLASNGNKTSSLGTSADCWRR